MIEKNFDRKLANRTSYQILDTNDAQKESLVGGSKSTKGDPHPLPDMDRGGAKSAVTRAQNVRDFW